ncbi:murein biosynthesis integral membrane protein MurJ [Candidatus Microgenomates bacterium]|nr:murein biosynthesis integral membrane protein MurJ [Candidatus Microgenomates bacterium]
MATSVFSKANRTVKISTAAALLAGSYFASALLGLLRDRLLAARFGLSGTLDAYFAAFSIPDLVYYLLVSGALAVAFIPVLTERLIHHNRPSAWELSSSMLNFLAMVTFVASIIIFIFADPLMWLVAPKFDPARHELAVNLTRILAVNPFLFSISTVFGSIQQAFGRFFFFALAPVFYNLGIIAGILGLSPRFGIGGVALGAVIGALVQLLVQQMGLIGLGFTYQVRVFWQNKGFRQVLRLMVPRSIDEGVEHLSAVIERAIASGLAVGSIAAYQYAFNLKNLPITIIGATIATAVFPKISERAAGTRTDALKKQVADTARVMLWMLIPTAGLFIILRGYIVRLLFGFGDPTTASILGWFAFAIVFQSLMRLVARVFYAYQDTKTPLYTSIMALVINVGAALLFVKLYGIRGLAMAQSLVATLEVLVLYVIMRSRLGPLITAKSIVNVIKIVLATLVTSTIAYLLVRFAFPLLSGETGFFHLAPKFAAIGSISVTCYIAVGWLFRISEAELVVSKVTHFIYRRLQIQP